MAEPSKPRGMAWQRDVLSLVPLTDDFFHLEGLWRLGPGSSPLERLLLWQPADEDDREFRRFLLDFGFQVLEAERTPRPPRRYH